MTKREEAAAVEYAAVTQGTELVEAAATFTARETELIELAATLAATKVYADNDAGQMDHYRIVERLLYNYKRLERLLHNEEEYLEVTWQERSGSIMYASLGEHHEGGIIETMQRTKLLSYERTAAHFREVEKVVELFKARKEFVVVRMRYFDEDLDGNARGEDAAPYTWEEIATELARRGVLKDEKTARRWRTNLVNDIAVCMFGQAAAISTGQYRAQRSRTE